MKAGSDGPSIKIIPFPSVKGKADDKTLGNTMKPIITRKPPTATRTSGQILSQRLAREKAKIEASMQLPMLEIKKSAPMEDSKEEVMVLPGLYKSGTEDITFVHSCERLEHLCFKIRFNDTKTFITDDITLVTQVDQNALPAPCSYLPLFNLDAINQIYDDILVNFFRLSSYLTSAYTA